MLFVCAHSFCIPPHTRASYGRADDGRPERHVVIRVPRRLSSSSTSSFSSRCSAVCLTACRYFDFPCRTAAAPFGIARSTFALTLPQGTLSQRFRMLDSEPHCKVYEFSPSTAADLCPQCLCICTAPLFRWSRAGVLICATATTRDGCHLGGTLFDIALLCNFDLFACDAQKSFITRHCSTSRNQNAEQFSG
eukprot:COSAG02_NODE_643_length_19037_cov_9.951632_15_plen_192_part_00